MGHYMCTLFTDPSVAPSINNCHRWPSVAGSKQKGQLLLCIFQFVTFEFTTSLPVGIMDRESDDIVFADTYSHCVPLFSFGADFTSRPWGTIWIPAYIHLRTIPAVRTVEAICSRVLFHYANPNRSAQCILEQSMQCCIIKSHFRMRTTMTNLDAVRVSVFHQIYRTLHHSAWSSDIDYSGPQRSMSRCVRRRRI